MSTPSLPPELQAVVVELDKADADARAVSSGLGGAQAAWREAPGSWSVSECLDHLAASNRVYLQAMRGAAEQARTRGRLRRRPALPGFVGRWFVSAMEPPAKLKVKTAAHSKPRPTPVLGDALDALLTSHEEIRRFIAEFADIDLAGVRFPNPFFKGVRFSLATGLHVVPAHDRRHLWQAWRVRRASEQALRDSPR